MKMGFVVVLMALLVTPAAAQGKFGSKTPQQEDEAAKNSPQAVAKRAAEEKAYRDALKTIPESKTKKDPWSGAR